MNNHKGSISSKVTNLADAKTINLSGSNVEEKRNEIINYFHTTFSLYEELFSFITDDGFYVRAEPLRHPLIFYFGHTATFIINKLIVSGFQIDRINPYFESIFAVGVDEMSWDDLNTEHYNWPSVAELREYRNNVRTFFDGFLKSIDFSLPIDWKSPMWIALMICEHERIHLETSSVIMRRLPLNYFINNEKKWKVCEEMINDLDKVPENESIQIIGKEVTLGKKDDFYGWDNEYGTLKVKVNNFSVDKFLTTNKEYLEFVKEGGYLNQEFWTDEGKKWLRFQTLNRPLFWSEDFSKLRLFDSETEMPWDWPVETNYLEAKAYCNWKSKKTGVYTRLISEPEWCVLRGDSELDGNINLMYYASSCPVNKFKHNFGVYDVVGNVWQWTETYFDGFPGFKVHPSYKDFSTPTFDGKHNLIKGGSWISTGNESILSSRYAFRRHFYQHAGFRCVNGDEIKQENIIIEKEPDVVRWIAAEYDKDMYSRFKLKCFTQTIIEEIKKFADESIFDKKSNLIKKKRILVLGCKTGGLAFELSKIFDEVVGMDQTAYHFKIAVDLKEGNTIRYQVKEEGEIFINKEIKTDLSSLKDQTNPKKVEFYQTDLYNDIDSNKHEKFDAIMISNVDDLDSIDGNTFQNNLNENGLIFVMVPKGKNLKDKQFPCTKYKKLNLIENTLNPLEHKILFRETARKHRLEIYEMHTFRNEIRENANSYYETDFLCEQYIRFHYANHETFPTTCAKVCLDVMKRLNFPESEYKSALDLGCALGQTAIYLSPKFESIVGIDYSKRFIEIANERIDSLQLKNVTFLHGSALELDEIPSLPKENVLVFCGNLIDRLHDPKIFLNDVSRYVKKGGVLILTSPYTWLEEFTPKENWIGGTIKNGEILSTILGLEHMLKEHFEKHSVEDVEFLIPDYPPFSHQITAAQLSVWVRK